MRELEAERAGARTNLYEFIRADLDLQQTVFGTLARELRFMELGPSNPPVPIVIRAKPFCDSTDTNFVTCTWDDLAAAAKGAAPVLRQIRQLAHQWIPQYVTPAQTPVFSLINESRWLAADAVSALHEGVRGRALTDLHSLTELALIGSHQKDHIAQIGRYGVIGIEQKATWEALQSADWTDPELRQIEADWHELRPLEAAKAAAEWELAQADGMGSAIQKELISSPWPDRLWAYVGALDKGQDAEFLLKWPLAHFEAAEALEKCVNWRLLQPGLQQLKFESSSKKRSNHRHLGLRLMLSRLDVTFETYAGLEATRQLLLTDIAIRRYKLRHQASPPKELRELSPELLDATTGRDIFGEGDLKYRANQDGTYLLYSVGMDGVDDGGDASANSGDVNLWISRDIVWPCYR